ncbi:hypothetical protein BDN70DRAFT_850949 [Pholiota conissans]|uniref:DUF6699 domain-containing protein n=1 Tax=Pholiota conissans TaxID=109636 RepID=A0A9P5ZAH9_9AGAR|nr:hypothetical protein BDN70DRAFT_850949 [Pholiota conissans]
MSDPYVYTPRVTYRNSPYLAPYYTQQNSPFIPPMTLNASPFSTSAPLPPVDPTMMMASPQHSPFVPNIPFPSSDSALDDDDYIDRYPRPRTTSWTGGMVPANMHNTAWLNPRSRPQRKRSRSAGYFDQPQVVNINNGYWVSPGPGTPYSPYSQLPSQPPQMALHPYLDGHNFRGDIIFDLMAPHFAPMKLLGNNQTILITNEELSQVATNPPIYNIKILNDLLPSWPIDLTWNPDNRYSAVAPPLKLGDILSAIYNALHMCVSQTYWALLPHAQVYSATRTYTARCRSMGPMEPSVALQGVKRIDFLNGQRWFRGLVHTSDPNILKFNVA